MAASISAAGRRELRTGRRRIGWGHRRPQCVIRASATTAPRRRVIGKSEWTHDEANPRFLVTSFEADAWRAQPLYERLIREPGRLRREERAAGNDRVEGGVGSARAGARFGAVLTIELPRRQRRRRTAPFDSLPVRQAPGDMPRCFLKARLKAASDS